MSPARASSNTYGTSHNYDNYGSSLGTYEISRVSSSANQKYSEPPRYTPARNNYLSTSSTDSAGTYINRIYDLEEDRVSVNEPKNLSNPFLRKNLLSNNQTEREFSTKNNYEDFSSSNMKYGKYDYVE